ncbi:MAG: septal ring lytic transglycosylase RlpA family protein [Acidobacteria bacterium]|jgi:rare lipoprotein A|nr:MAG: septal ring lytic transglycosylase RlpA family protein [Acidobacteriota bacterium]
MNVALVFFSLLFLLSCSVTVRDRTNIKESSMEVNCPSIVYARGYYCNESKAYSDKVQSGSRVRVWNESTGKSVTLAVYRREGIQGICLPESFRNLLGDGPFKARLEVQRCGVDDVRICPSYFKGLASYYKEPYDGRETPYGIKYDMMGYYAAHRELPLGTTLRVKNLRNGRETIVKVIDRGPFREGRVLDLSYAAARDLDMLLRGVEEVEAWVMKCGD